MKWLLTLTFLIAASSSFASVWSCTSTIENSQKSLEITVKEEALLANRNEIVPRSVEVLSSSGLIIFIDAYQTGLSAFPLFFVGAKSNWLFTFAIHPDDKEYASMSILSEKGFLGFDHKEILDCTRQF